MCTRCEDKVATQYCRECSDAECLCDNCIKATHRRGRALAHRKAVHIKHCDECNFQVWA